MHKLILLTLFTTFLSASYPKPYAVLGNVIYDSAINIEKLYVIGQCKLNKDEIEKYIYDVNETKEYGFELESKKKNRNKKVYLDKLRVLSKINDQYLRDAKSAYKRSMNENNYDLFHEIINSGLVDTELNKNEIIDYYYKHNEDINASGVIETFLEEDAKLKAQKESLKMSSKTKKELEAEKIKRIRENDKLAKSKLEEELQLNLDKKKLEIRTNQKKELSN